MVIHSKVRWVIMSKDRKVIAKGTPRNRELIEVINEKDKKRVLTYSSEGMARSGYTNSGFYGQGLLEGYDSRNMDGTNDIGWSLCCPVNLNQ